MKRFLRTTVKTSGVFALAVIIYLLLLAHPEPLFSYSITFDNITFYSNSRLPPETAAIASAVTQRLASSELYEPQLRQRVFVVERPWLWILLNGPYQHAIARNVELGNAILIPQLDVERQQIRHFDGRRAGAVGILTHEVVHTFVQRRIGLLRLWHLAWWQKEGYPEYIASERCADFKSPLRYQAAARAWKYLLETRQMSFDQVIGLRTIDMIPSEIRAAVEQTEPPR
jgi:hypothetical protein